MSVKEVEFFKGSVAGGGRFYRVKLWLTCGAWYCQNVNKAHGSSSVYFEIWEKLGVVQRCFSKKYECKQYRSPPVKIPASLHSVMFPLIDPYASNAPPELEEEHSAQELEDAGRVLENIITNKWNVDEGKESENFNDPANFELGRLPTWRDVDMELHSTYVKNNPVGPSGGLFNSPDLVLNLVDVDKLSSVKLFQLNKARAKQQKQVEMALKPNAGGGEQPFEQRDAFVPQQRWGTGQGQEQEQEQERWR